MARLIKLARSPYPLPLAGLKSEHSLLGLDNLVEAIDKVLAADQPLKRPFIVADPKPLTIAAMIAAMRQGLGRRPALFYVPKPLLKVHSARQDRADSCAPLFGSLVADSTALSRLDWVPPVETEAGTRRASSRRSRCVMLHRSANATSLCNAKRATKIAAN